MDEEQLIKAQKERQIRKGKKKQSFLKGLLRFLTALLILIGVYYFSTLNGWYLPKDSFKTFKRVQVVNNKIVKTQTVYDTVKDFEVPHKPLYLVNLNQIKYKLMGLSPVESVYIRRYAFPARVLIIIREATPVISIAPDEKVKSVAVFTKEGKLISGAQYMPLEFNVLKVLSYGNKGDDYRKWDLNKVNEFTKIAKYVEAYSKEPVEYIDVRNPNDLYVKVKSVKIRLGKLDSKIYDRIKRIPSIMPEAEKVKNKVKYIDLSWDKVNYLKLED